MLVWNKGRHRPLLYCIQLQDQRKVQIQFQTYWIQKGSHSKCSLQLQRKVALLQPRVPSSFLLSNYFFYLKDAVYNVHTGNACMFMAWHSMASLMMTISTRLRRFRGVWHTRNTKTMPMKTMAKLSSCFRRACWVAVAEVLDIDIWRRFLCLTSL